MQWIPSFEVSHVYMEVWEAAIGQILPCQQEGSIIPIPMLLRRSYNMLFQGMSPDSELSGCNLFWGRVLDWIFADNTSRIGKEM